MVCWNSVWKGSAPRTMCVDGWEIRGRDPEAKSPHINPGTNGTRLRVFFSFSLPVVPPSIPLLAAERASARVISFCLFYFKNERAEERATPRGYRGDGASGGGDTLLIKTIDLSPGLRMHLEINTRGCARAHLPLERIFPRKLERAFPDDHPCPILDARTCTLFAIRENSSTFSILGKRIRRHETKTSLKFYYSLLHSLLRIVIYSGALLLLNSFRYHKMRKKISPLFIKRTGNKPVVKNFFRKKRGKVPNFFMLEKLIM